MLRVFLGESLGSKVKFYDRGLWLCPLLRGQCKGCISSAGMVQERAYTGNGPPCSFDSELTLFKNEFQLCKTT